MYQQAYMHIMMHVAESEARQLSEVQNAVREGSNLTEHCKPVQLNMLVVSHDKNLVKVGIYRRHELRCGCEKVVYRHVLVNLQFHRKNSAAKL